jgi:hypothetical protein
MEAINLYYPRSGKPVSADSLTNYKDVIVGFFNTGCRDDFGKNSAEFSADRNDFGVLLRGENMQKIKLVITTN